MQLANEGLMKNYSTLKSLGALKKKSHEKVHKNICERFFKWRALNVTLVLMIWHIITFCFMSRKIRLHTLGLAYRRLPKTPKF
jgi:hypothetical protein